MGMCPAEHRLPEMDGAIRDMFGSILVSEASRKRQSSEQNEIKFRVANSQTAEPATAPGVRPLLPDDLQHEWNGVFDNFDTDEEDRVTVKSLESSGLLSTTVCYAIAALIDPHDPNGFTREGFLDMM